MASRTKLVDNGKSVVEQAIGNLFGEIRVPRNQKGRCEFVPETSPASGENVFGNGNVLVASGVSRKALLGW